MATFRVGIEAALGSHMSREAEPDTPSAHTVLHCEAMWTLHIEHDTPCCHCEQVRWSRSGVSGRGTLAASTKSSKACSTRFARLLLDRPHALHGRAVQCEPVTGVRHRSAILTGCLPCHQSPGEWPAAVRQLVSQREADAAEAATAEVRCTPTAVADCWS